MLLMVTALLLLSKSTNLNISDSDHNFQSFHLVGPLLSILTKQLEGTCLLYSFPIYKPYPGFTYFPSHLDFMIYHFTHCIGNFYIFYWSSVLLIHLYVIKLYFYKNDTSTLSVLNTSKLSATGANHMEDKLTS